MISYSPFQENGFQFLQKLFAEDELTDLIEFTEIYFSKNQAGIRNLLSSDAALSKLATTSKLQETASNILESSARPVRMILLNKVSESNWGVPWHQDVNIAVRERKEVPGYGPWSIKEGVHHVVPPKEVLENMVTLRVHLDDCHEQNGPLIVSPQSHINGVQKESEVDRKLFDQNAVTCIAKAGDVLAMSPLIWHSSKKSKSNDSRRIIHIEYTTGTLADGLEWAAL